MTRKSKQPGGHNPLTYHEQKRLKSSGYGTQSCRLGTESQLPFGSCCLGLSPAVDPVATPSGHIYSREAIMEYLLTKNVELKRRRAEYEAQCAALAKRQVQAEERQKGKERTAFVRKDQGAMQQTEAKTASSSRELDEGKASLKKSSFWLSASQPIHAKAGTAAGSANAKGGEDKADVDKEWEAMPPPPPERPPSPMSGQPLKLKQLKTLHLERENDAGSKSGGNGRKVLCAVSSKAITTQSAVAITKSGQVMLLSVYNELAKPTMTCPVTGKKFKDKDVLPLNKAASGFAASGKVVATSYRPTLT